MVTEALEYQWLVLIGELILWCNSAIKWVSWGLLFIVVVGVVIGCVGEASSPWKVAWDLRWGLLEPTMDTVST